MTAPDFAAWLAHMNYSERDAAKALDLSRNTVARYRSGEHEIPLHVALACSALVFRLPPYKAPG